MKLLIAFLKDKTREISLYAGTVGIFIVVAFLYNIRMDALKYALLLVILWLLLYVITEYHRFRKKHLLLERFKKSTQECTKELPECRNLLELDYQELLGIFGEKIVELKSEARIKGQDLSDFMVCGCIRSRHRSLRCAYCCSRWKTRTRHCRN